MGYAYYVIDGKECGYAVEAVCEQEGCTTEIDRGLAYACGGTPYQDNSCAGYFCTAHLFYPDEGPPVCAACLELLAVADD